MKLFLIGNNNKVVIEEGVTLKNGTLWLEDDGNEIIIKKGTTIEQVHIAVAERTKIVIGEDCMFSENIRIATSDAHSVIDLKENRRVNQAKNIEIGNHVWIGNKVSIGKGVMIEDNSIVASNSLVTHNVLSNTIVAGIPAKIIKKNITWSRKRI